MFANPGFLLWATAAVVPLIIHLWLRRHHREIPWGAMRLMRVAIDKKAKPFRIWQWLLLALRTLAIIVLALAVAQPLGCHPDTSLTSRRNNLIVFVLDHSFSMQKLDASGESLWQKAIGQASQICRESQAGDGFLVVLMGNPPSAPLPQVSIDSQQVVDLLNRLPAGFGTADASATIPLVQTIAEKALGTTNRFAAAKVLFWSDLQSATWQPIVDQKEIGGLKTLSKLAGVEFPEVDSVDSSNVNFAVSDVQIESPLLVADRPLNVLATVRNYSASAKDSLPISLVVLDHVSQTEPVNLAAVSQTTASFSLQLPAGEQIIRIEAAADRLPVDDRRWAVIPLREQIRVAVVATDPDAAKLFATAAVPDESNRSIELIRGDESFIMNRSQDYDVVVLCDLEAISARLVNFLREAQSRGSSIITWVGSRTRASEFNRLLADQEAGPLVPARLNKPSEFSTYAIDPHEYEHPIIAPFASYPNSGLLTVPLFRLWEVEKPASEGVQVIMSTADGKPLILIASEGEGGPQILLTVPADLSTAEGEPWTGLAAWPSFPPLVQNLIQWSSSPRRPDYLVGQTLRQSVPSADARTAVQVTLPTGDQVTVPVQSVGNRKYWAFSQTDQPGIYQYETAEGRRSIAVNIDPLESDLTAIDRGSLLAGLNSSSPVTSTAEPNEIAAKKPLFRYFLFGLLCVLAMEMLVARAMQWRFG